MDDFVDAAQLATTLRQIDRDDQRYNRRSAGSPEAVRGGGAEVHGPPRDAAKVSRSKPVDMPKDMRRVITSETWRCLQIV